MMLRKTSVVDRVLALKRFPSASAVQPWDEVLWEEERGADEVSHSLIWTAVSA
jgi:hypothetical protein